MNLKTGQTPALLLYLYKFTRNCNWMKEKAERLHVALRPHLKTGKCIEFAKVQMTSPSGPATVSTLLEAEYFFNLGVIDLIYAVGISPGKFERAINLREAGCDLKVILDNKETAEQFSAYCEERKIPCPVLIEIDVDGHRSGVKPDSDGLIEIAKILQGKAYFAGVLTHAGDSYKCVGQAACLKAQENERDSLVHCANRLRKAGFDPKIISAGSTPTAVFAESWEGVTEVRCGVYCLFDLVMAGLKVCTIDQIALSLLVEVTGHQKEKGWIITDGGWMALSRDRGTAAQAVDQADEAGYLVMLPGGECYGEIVKLFGRQITTETGELDRKRIAEIVFQDEEKLKALNAIVHPAVKRYIKKAIAAAEKAGTEYVFVEAALLIEEKYDEICDELWYIYADEEVRKERLIEGRGYSEKKVREIMANQLSEDEFSSHCDFEIDNSGDFEETKKQLDHRMKKYETL